MHSVLRPIPVVATLVFAGLAACTAEAPPAPAPQPPVATLVPCGGDSLVPLIGQPVAALPPGLPPGTRVIRPGDAVTEDYSESRLNVDLDAGDRIVRLWCG